jgi:hypothetical protein
VRVAALGLSKTDRAQARMPGLPRPEPEIVRRRLDTLRQFRWSSYPAYAGHSSAPTWLTREHIFEAIGKGSLDQRQRRYRDYVETAVRQGLTATPWEQLRARLILGSEKFMRKIQATLTGNKREQPSLRRATDRPDWTRAIAAVEQTKGARWCDFAEKRGDTGRDLALYLARKHCQLKLAELGTLAGGMDYASVSIAIQRFHRRLKGDKLLAKQAARAEEIMLNVEI